MCKGENQMKHKKILLIALICLIGIGISVLLFSGHRPFKNLTAEDITSANVRLSPPPDVKIGTTIFSKKAKK